MTRKHTIRHVPRGKATIICAVCNRIFPQRRIKTRDHRGPLCYACHRSDPTPPNTRHPDILNLTRHLNRTNAPPHQRIAILASRSLTKTSAVIQLIQRLPLGASIITTRSSPLERTAEREAKKRNLPVLILQPDHKRNGNEAAATNYRKVIDQATYLVAFWDEQSRGTVHAIRLALYSQAHPTPTAIFNPQPPPARQIPAAELPELPENPE